MRSRSKRPLIFAGVGMWMLLIGGVGYVLGPRLVRRAEHALVERPDSRLAEVEQLLRDLDRRAEPVNTDSLDRLAEKRGSQDSQTKEDIELIRYLSALRGNPDLAPRGFRSAPRAAQAMRAWVRAAPSSSAKATRRKQFATKFPRSWQTHVWRRSGELPK